MRIKPTLNKARLRVITSVVLVTRIWVSITGVALVVALVLTFLPYEASIDTGSIPSIGLKQASANPDTLTVRPNAVGDESNCAVSGDTPGWKCVDEAVADDDSTYVFCYSGTSPRDLYNLADVDLAGTINYVRVYVRVRRTTNAPNLRVRTVIKLGEVVVEGSDISIITSYANYYTDYATKPGGGTWTWTDINNLQAGVHLNVYSVLYLARCTQVYVEVDYTPIVAPTVVTNDSPDVSYAWGNICANITAIGATNVTTRGFQWGTTTSNYTASWNETGNWGVACEFCHNITNLGCNETYYFRGFATNSAGTGYGDEESFTTDVCTAATVATHNATSVSYTYANLNGNITAIVDENCFTRGFKWDTNSGAPYVNEWHEDGDFNEGTFSYNATSLDDNQQYYFVAYATNHAGTSYGDELDFTTLAYTAPEITTQNATDVSYFTATLNADIDSVDGVNATCRGFEWGLDTGNYTWSWNETDNYGTGTFDYGLDSLLDNQLYFFRAFTINEGGTGYGGELNYTTLEALPPTVTSSNATNITHNSATTYGNITDLGGLTVTVRGFEWDIDTGAPYANDWHEDGSYGVCSFNHTLTLPSATTIYWRAYATNPDGTGYSTELNFLTLPAAPTNLTATDGDFTDVVVVNWTQLPGNITGYYIFEDSNLLNTLGNVASYNDTAAPAPTITPGNATASDGISVHNVTLLLVGYSANNGTARDYYVIAFNDAGNSTASNNDTGFTSIGELEYQWYRSADDSATNFTALVGATNYTYVDTTTPTPALTIGTADASDGNSTIVVYLGLVDTEGVDGEGRHYLCALNATDAASQNSTPDRGYRGAPALTYEWWRSEGDSDQDYTGIPGATTASYNDTGGVVDPSGRYYRCLVTMGDIDEQTTNADRGYLDPGGIMIIMIFGIICLGLMIAGFVLKQAQAVLLLLAGTGWVVFGALLFTSNVEQNTALFLTGLALAFACFTWPLVFWLRGRSKLSASERDYENYKQQVLKVTHQEKTEI